MNILTAHCGQNLDQIDAITLYLNSNINIILYIKILTGYKIVGKFYFPKKTIYKLKRLACKCFKNLNKIMIKAVIKRLMLNYSAFVKNLGTSKVIIIIVYIIISFI